MSVRNVNLKVTLLAATVVSFLSLGLRALVPMTVIGDATLDDLLFVEQSDHLAKIEWLGPYKANFTLAKGPGFPAFLAVNRFTHVPLMQTQHLLHLAAGAVVAVAVSRLTRQRVLGLVAFFVIAFDPSYLGGGSSRVVRDNWYASICLMLFALIALSVARPRVLVHRRGTTIAAGVGLGVLAAAYWLGREERPWLAPSLLLLLAAGAARQRRHPSRSWRAWTVTAAVTGTVAVGCVGGVLALNQQYYGASLTNDVTEGQFAHAYGLWQSVEAGTPRQFVPISAAQRAAVYAVSPAARELRSYLDGPPAQGWIDPSCSAVGVCDDLAGGWTQWAIRQGLQETGRYRNAAETQRYYTRLAEEIGGACRVGSLQCGLAMPSLLPAPDNVRAGAYVHSFVTAGDWLVRFRMGEQIDGVSSSGSDGAWALFRSSVPGVPASLADQQNREREYASRAGPVRALVTGYGLLVPVGLVIALIGLVVAPIRRRPGWGPAFSVAAAALVAVIVRLALLALIDSTSFPAAQTVYALPASSLLLLVVVLGGWLLIQAVRPRVTGARLTAT